MFSPIRDHFEKGALIDAPWIRWQDPADQECDKTEGGDGDRDPGESIHLGVFNADGKEDDHAPYLGGELRWMKASVSEISLASKPLRRGANPYAVVSPARM